MAHRYQEIESIGRAGGEISSRIEDKHQYGWLIKNRIVRHAPSSGFHNTKIELKILTKSPLTPLFQRGEPIVIPLCPVVYGEKDYQRGKYFSSLWSPTQSGL